MYSFLNPQIQTKISKEFKYVNENDLSRMLDILSRVRNVCAHNERLYDYKYKNGALSNTLVHDTMKIKKVKGKYICGKSDVFAVIISLKYLLYKDEFHSMIEEIELLIQGLESSTKLIPRRQVEKQMGFPVEWKKVDLLELDKLYLT